MHLKERAIHTLAGVAATVAVFAIVRVALPKEPPVPSGADGVVQTEQSALADAEANTHDFVPPADLMRKQLEDWQRKPGPVKIALQAGHWKSEDAPDEQDNLRFNGAEAAGKEEWEITLAIAERAAALLRAKGYEVEILPTVVPPVYFADVFVSVHADESPNKAVRGYRTAPSWLDFAGTSGALSDAVDAAYGEATGQPHYPEITDAMRMYYAFNWLNFKHSLHPKTPAVIIETGYMTNAQDRAVIYNQPDRAARGIADGIVKFLEANPVE